MLPLAVTLSFTLCSCGTLAPVQRRFEALNKIIERQGWAVPPRFRPFADPIERPWLHSKKPLYRIMLCPGLAFEEVYDDVQELARLSPPGCDYEFTIERGSLTG